MLDQIKITSFKSIREATLDLGEMNVFIGANGSGKSNILEAIGVLGAAASGSVDTEALLRRGVRPGLPALYKSSFRDTPTRNAIRFEALAGDNRYTVELHNPTRQPAWQFKTEELILGGTKFFGRSPRSREYHNLDKVRGIAALKVVEFPPDSDGAMLFRALREFAIHTPNTPTLRDIAIDPQSRAPVGLSGGRLAEAVDELRQLSHHDERIEELLEDVTNLVDWAESFVAREGANIPMAPSVPRRQKVLVFRDRYMARRRNELSAYDASEGALYILFSAVLAGHPMSPGLLAVDNFDAALNPRLVRALTRDLSGWVLGNGRQLLLTCHNPMVLDGLDISDDRVRLFAVDRSSKGVTVVKRVIVDKPLLEKAEAGWPLSRLWVSGHLGGVPHV